MSTPSCPSSSSRDDATTSGSHPRPPKPSPRQTEQCVLVSLGLSRAQTSQGETEGWLCFPWPSPELQRGVHNPARRAFVA